MSDLAEAHARREAPRITAVTSSARPLGAALELDVTFRAVRQMAAPGVQMRGSKKLYRLSRLTKVAAEQLALRSASPSTIRIGPPVRARRQSLFSQSPKLELKVFPWTVLPQSETRLPSGSTI